MIEMTVVIGVLGVLGAAILLGTLAPELVLGAGAMLIVLGLLVGLPSSGRYHQLLHRALRARGPIPARWWVNPVPHHRALEAPSRGPVLSWFYAGAIGFGVAILGCVLVLISVLRAR
jgi:hypothetical protein